MKGGTHLARLDTVTGRLEEILTPYSGGARQIRDIAVGPDHAVFVGGSPTEAESVVQIDLRTPKLRVLRRSRDVTVDNRYLSIPRHVEFQTTNGDRKSTRLNSSHVSISYAVFCLKKKRYTIC